MEDPSKAAGAGGEGAGTAPAQQSASSDSGIASKDGEAWRRERLAEKKRADGLQKQVEELTTKIGQHEEAQKTEREKEIERVRKETREGADKEWGEKMVAEKLSNRLSDELRSRGYDPDLAFGVRAHQEIGTEAEVPAAVESYLKSKGWPEKVEGKTAAPGYPGGAAPQGTQSSWRPWTPDKVNKARIEEGDKFINDHWNEINADLYGTTVRK